MCSATKNLYVPDYAVPPGEIMQETLEESGKADDTMIIFTSDHGDMQGSHGLINKCLPHEESAGIPLIVYAPGMADQGKESDALICGIDFLPTCLDMAGLPALDTTDGTSFGPVLRGEKEKSQHRIFSERANWCMIVKDNWKLVGKRDEDPMLPTMLIDLETDPYELTNRVDDPELSNHQDSLLAELVAWNQELQANKVDIG